MLPFGRVDGGVDQHVAHVLHGHAHGGEPGRIDLHPDGGLLLSADENLGNARDLRDLLRQDGLGVVVHLGERQGLGIDGEDQDRRIGRIGLPVRGRTGQCFRQASGGGVDGGLDVSGRGIDVPVKIELHDDLRNALHAHGGQLRHAGNRGDLRFERLSHRARHGLGTRAGQLALHHDGGEIDARQRGDGQEREGGKAGQHQRRHQQRRGDRPFDKRSGDTHGLTFMGLSSCLGLLHRHPHPVIQPRLPLQHHLLTRFEAGGDHGDVPMRLDRYRLTLYG